MPEAQRVLVRGRVQGVGFRAWTQRTARDLGLSGWVRNLADGRVEAQLEGTAETLDRMVERMRAGPGPARPDEVSAKDADVEGCVGFEIRR